MLGAMEPESCTQCGACCFSADDRHVLVRLEDHTRLGARAEALTHFRHSLCFMRMPDGYCAALEIHPDGRFLCSVYEQRPDICRELERGSPACAHERDVKRTLRDSGLAYHVAAERLRGPR
jgi:Fe-S-cluster containining protein